MRGVLFLVITIGLVSCRTNPPADNDTVKPSLSINDRRDAVDLPLPVNGARPVFVEGDLSKMRVESSLPPHMQSVKNETESLKIEAREIRRILKARQNNLLLCK